MCFFCIIRPPPPSFLILSLPRTPSCKTNRHQCFPSLFGTIPSPPNGDKFASRGEGLLTWREILRQLLSSVPWRRVTLAFEKNTKTTLRKIAAWCTVFFLGGSYFLAVYCQGGSLLPLIKLRKKFFVFPSRPILWVQTFFLILWWLIQIHYDHSLIFLVHFQVCFHESSFSIQSKPVPNFSVLMTTPYVVIVLPLLIFGSSFSPLKHIFWPLNMGCCIRQLMLVFCTHSTMSTRRRFCELDWVWCCIILVQFILGLL